MSDEQIQDATAEAVAVVADHGDRYSGRLQEVLP
jgi:hypothetical protein